MGPEDRAKCWCRGPELGRGRLSPCGHTEGRDGRCARCWGGRDRVDGQILGQLRPLAEEEEAGEPRAGPPRPAFPGMGSEQLRLPELLAAAGFFHTGQQDKVRCFFCYGGLQSWEQGDDPWTEHAKWFPRCEFLLQTKGRDFVCSVQEACCHLLGSWDPSEEPEDTAPATPSAPVHMSPELPTPRREVQSEGAREPGKGVEPRPRGCCWVLEPPGARDAEEQLQRLREERVCKVCLDRTVCTVFVPCGHLVCAECAPALQLCPVCRAPIRSCVRTFLP
uniref:RING-type E3 ubiquitin transferase n=1 Tax=Canis lupus familiaris TaxID=9615 RepID=A0A8C0TPV6_CANLF